jgi:hypothetical protein
MHAFLLYALHIEMDVGAQLCSAHRHSSNTNSSTARVCRLLEMIGSSRQIYKGIVELLRVRWTAAVQDARGCVSMDTDLLPSLRLHLLLSLKRNRVEHVDRRDSLLLTCNYMPRCFLMMSCSRSCMFRAVMCGCQCAGGAWALSRPHSAQ